MEGNMDVIFVHDRAREEEFVADGYGAYRLGVMHNDFVILGPSLDPAQVKGEQDAVIVLRKIARSKAGFVLSVALGILLLLVSFAVNIFFNYLQGRAQRFPAFASDGIFDRVQRFGS